MKKLGLIIAGALVCSAGIMAAVAGEKVITTTQLPQKAQTFIKKHYSGTRGFGKGRQGNHFDRL